MWDYIKSLWERALNWWRETIYQSVIEPIRQYVEGATRSIRDILANFGRELSDVLGQLFSPILDFISGTFYVIDRVAAIVGLIIKILLLMIQVLFSVAEGLVRTLSSIASFDPSSVAPADKSGYAAGIDWFMARGWGLDILAQVLAVGVWIAAAAAIVRLVGTGGGEA